jgi:hypothetical protein
MHLCRKTCYRVEILEPNGALFGVEHFDSLEECDARMMALSRTLRIINTVNPQLSFRSAPKKEMAIH